MAWLKKTAPARGCARAAIPRMPMGGGASGIHLTSKPTTVGSKQSVLGQYQNFHIESGTGQQLKARASSYTAELSVDFGDWSPLEFDGFSDKRKLIAWAGPNDQLAPIAGSS